MSYGLTPARETRRLPDSFATAADYAPAPVVMAAVSPMRAASAQSVVPLEALTITTTASTLLLKPNPGRVSAVIRNVGSVVVLSGADLESGLSPVTAGGMTLGDGETLTLKTTGEIRVKCQGGFGVFSSTLSGLEIVSNSKQL